MQKQSKSFYKKGAEAELTQKEFDGKAVLSKKRIPKGYRNPVLDLDIRKKRTRAEAKLLREAALYVNAPKVIKHDEENAEILMEFISGNVLKEVLAKNTELCIRAGEEIKKLHSAGIIHGDLTTSNIIFADETKELESRIKKHGRLFFVDFGLGSFSRKIEDVATDLVVFKKTFNATHSGIKNGWELVMKGYAPSRDLIDRMNAIEKRARYH